MADVNKVSLCSNAFVRLGANPINDANENNDRARLVALYDNLRDSLLRSHVWNCAVKRVILAPDTATPVFDFTNKFVLPSDWLRTMQVGQKDERLDYRIEAGYILADTDTLYLRYIYRNEVEATWDTMLIEAMELTLVHAFAYAITQSSAAKDGARDDLQKFLKTAQAVDGIEEPAETFGDSYLINSRYASR